MMSIPAADNELSDAEIHERFGPLLAEAHEAFRTDGAYIVAIAEYSAAVRRKREYKRQYRASLK